MSVLDPKKIALTVSPTLSVSDITSGSVNGSGVFDTLMGSVAAHLQDQFDIGRITATEFSAVYLEALKHTLTVSVEVTFQKEKQAYELTILERQIQLQDEELKLAKLNQDNSRKQNRLIERETIRTDAQTDLIHYDLRFKFPAERENTLKQGQILDKEIGIKEYQLANLMPNELARGVQQIDVVERTTILQENQSAVQIADTEATTAIKEYQLSAVMPVEVANATKQGAMLTEQTAAITKEIEIKQQQLLITEKEVLVAEAKLANIPKEGVLLDKQADSIDSQLLTAVLQRTTIESDLESKVIERESLTADIAIKEKQLEVNDSQIASQEAQTALYVQKTLSERANVDPSVVMVGSSVNLQNKLLEAQAVAFDKDAQQKVMKLLLDSWAVRYQDDPETAIVGVMNQLHDPNIGNVVRKALNSIGVTPVETAVTP